MEEPFKEIALVPDCRVVELLRAKRSELESVLSSAESDQSILKLIAKEDRFRKFVKSLSNVENYLDKKNIKLTCEQSKQLASILKEKFQLTREEIVMIINQPPINDSQLEIMFPGKFSKEQAQEFVSIINLIITNDTT